MIIRYLHFFLLLTLGIEAFAWDQFVLEGNAVDYRRIDLLWNSVPKSQDSSEVEGKFEIYKDGNVWKTINQRYVDQRFCISHSTCDYGVEAQSTHTYYVRGYDVNGTFIGQSNSLTITTPEKYSYNYLPAFPGAEGFGAKATGGRGGRVIYVTNLNKTGAGSLHDALLESGPRYILFKISGVVEMGGWYNMNGEYTFAGHTSPGGITTNGFISCSKEDASYTGMHNVIIRHLRSRPDHQLSDLSDWPSSYTPSAEELTWGSPGGSDDAMRLEKTKEVIVDHCSFGRAGDECFQFSASNFVTVQNTIMAETVSGHYGLGGMLLSYNSISSPLNNITIHHNMWNRISGRLPEIGCNDGRGNDVVFNFELSNNLIWDPGTTITVGWSGAPYNPQDSLFYHLNWIGNYMYARSGFKQGMIEKSILGRGFKLYLNDNRMNIYPQYSDYQLVYGNTDFYKYHPNTTVGLAERLTVRHPYAPVTYTPSSDLINYMIENVGAFPRDPMDRRLIGYLEDGEIALIHLAARPANDGHSFDWQSTPIPPLDSDDDGMPDWWELHNGLNPLEQDHNGKECSTIYTGVEGYDNLECYLNKLSDYYVNGVSLVEGEPAVYDLNITDASASKKTLIIGVDSEVGFSVSIENPADIVKVEISVDLLENPFAFPSPETVLMSKDGDTWKYNYVLREDMLPGKYEVLIHAEDNQGKDGYAIIEFTIENPNITSLADKQIRQDNSILSQNYPNPFSSATTISFEAPERGYYSLIIFDITGREITVLFDGHATAGINEINWDGTNSAGERVSSGMYFYQLKTSYGFLETKKMMFYNKTE